MNAGGNGHRNESEWRDRSPSIDAAPQNFKPPAIALYSNRFKSAVARLSRR
jgi:hypothetical protein